MRGRSPICLKKGQQTPIKSVSFNFQTSFFFQLMTCFFFLSRLQEGNIATQEDHFQASAEATIT